MKYLLLRFGEWLDVVELFKLIICCHIPLVSVVTGYNNKNKCISFKHLDKSLPAAKAVKVMYQPEKVYN